MHWDRLAASHWRLRQIGAVLLLGSCTAGHHLLALGSDRAGNAPPAAYLLALVAFLGLSSGCALVIHGRHLFDKIEVSERWRPALPVATTSSAASEAEDYPRRDPTVDASRAADGASPRTPMPETPWKRQLSTTDAG